MSRSMVKTAIIERADPETLRILLSRISERIRGECIRSMIMIALKENSGPEILKVLLDQTPESIDGRYIDEIWSATRLLRRRMSDEEIKHFRESLEELKRQRGIE